MQGMIHSSQRLSAKAPVHYSILSLLLWNNSVPQLLEIALKIFSEVQIIALLGTHTIYYFSLKNPNDHQRFAVSLHKYLTFDIGDNFIKNATRLNITATVAIIYTLAVLILMLYSLLVNFSQIHKRPTLIKTWIYFGVIHYTILFLGIQRFILSIATALIQKDLAYTFPLESKTFTIFMIIIVLSVNLIFGFLNAGLAYNPIQDGSLLSTRTSNYFTIGLLFKLVQTIINGLIANKGTRTWLGLIIAFILLSFRLHRYLVELPFYKYKTLRLFLVFLVMELSQVTLNIIWTLVAIKRNVPSFIVLCSQTIFAVIFYKLCQTYIENVIWRFALKPNRHIKTIHDFYMKLFALNRILLISSSKSETSDETRRNPYELLSVKLVSLHAQACIKPNCACKIILLNRTIKLGALASMTHIPDRGRFYFEYIRDFYSQTIQIIPNSSLLKLQLAYLLVEHDDAACMSAIHLINDAISASKESEIRILAFKLLRKVEEMMQTAFFSDNVGLKVKRMIEHKLTKATIIRRIADNTKLFISFWEAFSAPRPKIKKLLTISQRANIDAEQITKLWENLNREFLQLCYKEYIIYGLYLRYIRNAPFTSDKIFNKYFSMVTHRLNVRNNLNHGQDIFFDEDKIIVSVSLNTGTFGSINYVSQSIERLGYSTKNILGKDCSLLMPPFFAQRCHSFLREQLQPETDNVMHKRLPIFINVPTGKYVQRL